jgi:hypothetical protein
MSVLPVGTQLGDLTIGDVFFDYEGPKLFSARNATGQRYLAVAVDEEDSEAHFLYVAMSAERYMAVRSGLLGLREALAAPEGDLLLVRSDYRAASHRVSVVDPASVTPDWLPDEDAVLDVPTDTQPRFDPDALKERADSEVRSFMALRLSRPDLLRTEYPVRDLNEMLDDVQESVHAFAAEAEDRATGTGAIPTTIVRDSELSIVDLQAASFVVVLASSTGGRLFDSDLAATAADRLLSLIDAAGDESSARAAIATLKERGFAKFRGLLEDVVATEATLSVYSAQPGRQLKEAGITPAAASSALGIMDEATTDTDFADVASGVLVGANVRTRSFELRDDEAGATYVGKVSDEAVPQIDGLQLGEAYRYRARVKIVETFGSAAAGPKVAHTLESIYRTVGPEY